jgi:hypothetical protein
MNTAESQLINTLKSAKTLITRPQTGEVGKFRKKEKL